MGSIQDRNGMDPTEAEDIQKRWQEYTEEPYKNDPHDPDNHDGVIPDLEPDILECEVKWALVWVNSGRWWWTGRPWVLWFMGSQRIRHDWVTELNWTEDTS